MQTYLRLFVVILSLVSLSRTQSALLDLQAPPSIIALPPGVQFLYDISDYVYTNNGAYVLNNQSTMDRISQPLNQTNQPNNFKIAEKKFGGWDLTKPALLLTTDQAPNSYSLYWDIMTNKTYLPTPRSEQKFTFSVADNVKCFDVVAIDTQTALIDCVESNTNGQAVSDWVYYVNFVTQTFLYNSSTQPLASSSSSCTRKIAYYNFDTHAWLYRWPTIKCLTQQQPNSPSIQILNAKNLQSITHAYALNKTIFKGPDLYLVSIFMGDIFIANPNSPQITRIMHINYDYSTIKLCQMSLPEGRPVSINAIYDIVAESTSVSLLVTTSNRLIRIDWSSDPFIIEDLIYSTDSSSSVVPSDNTGVWASENFYYALFDPTSIVVFLRKPQNVSILYGTYKTSNDTQNRLVILRILGAPQYMSVDIDQDYFYLATNQTSAIFKSLRPVLQIGAEKFDKKLSFSVSVTDNSKTTFAYNQKILISDGTPSGMFTDLIRTSTIYSPNADQPTLLPGLFSFNDPQHYAYIGSLKKTTLMPRYEPIPFTPAANNIVFNYIMGNPFRRSIFYWLSQDSNNVVYLRGCTLSQVADGQNTDIVCTFLANITLGKSVNKAALGVSSQTGKLELVVLGTKKIGRASCRERV